MNNGDVKTELSIKLVEGGSSLVLKVKRITLKGEPLDASQVQSVCSEIGKRYKIPAVPYCEQDRQELLIPDGFYLPPNASFTINDWVITASAPAITLTLSYTSNAYKQLIADLFKRALLIQAKKKFWTLDSPRILYELQPFEQIGLIKVFRRFEISETIQDQGLGISVGLTTSFFSKEPVEYYYENGRIEEFNALTNRQNEQQGTMLYKGPNGYTKCYFVKYGYAKKLIETDQFKENGIEYKNSYDYYSRKYHGKYDVSPDDKVALVSFPNFPNKVYVPAKNLFPRIFNSSLPVELQNIDKISAGEKRTYIQEHFWKILGDNPFGRFLPKISKNFLTPRKEDFGLIPMPAIICGQNKVIASPEAKNEKIYKNHYQARKSNLDKYGCYFVPPTLSGSKLYFLFPNAVEETIRKRFVQDTLQYLQKVTRNEVEFEVIIPPTYHTYLEATVHLKNNYDNGMVIFVFDDTHPATYSLIDYELKGWGLKRATAAELQRKYRHLTRFEQALKVDHRYEDAKRSWDSYIEMNTLGILQKLNCIPFVVAPENFYYDMQIMIDVSEDFSHFCLSGMLYKPGMPIPILPCNTIRKTDAQQETINRQILKDELIKFFKQVKRYLNKYQPQKFLFARDGKDCKDEFNAIKEAFLELQQEGIIGCDAVLDFVEYHKTTKKEVRMWDVFPDGGVGNVLEGTFYMYRKNMAILCTTGGATLSKHVTADPITVVNKYTNANLMNVLSDLFYGAQFNFSSPRVAQKHTLPMKRADDELAEKRAQEIKRLK